MSTYLYQVSVYRTIGPLVVIYNTLFHFLNATGNFALVLIYTILFQYTIMRPKLSREAKNIYKQTDSEVFLPFRYNMLYIDDQKQLSGVRDGYNSL